MSKSFLGRAVAFIAALGVLVPVQFSTRGEDPPYGVLDNLARIHELPEAEARKGYPVEFKAVVTSFEPSVSALFVQAGSEAIYVRYAASELLPRPGDEVLIKGFTIAAAHNYVVASTIAIASPAAGLPEPLPVEGDAIFDYRLDCKRAAIIGTIEQVKVDGSKWAFSVRQRGREFSAHLLSPPRTPLDPREWIGARAQFVGPLSVRAPQGDSPQARINCPTLADIRVVAAPSQPQQEKISGLAKWVGTDQRLSIIGRITSSGKFTTVKDDSGEMSIAPLPFARVGDEVEVKGFAARVEGVATVSPADATLVERDEKGQRRRLITTIAEVRGLSRAEADQGLPVRLRAILTYSEPGSHNVFAHDGANGVYVWLEKIQDELRAGYEVEVVGKTGGGLFASIVDAGRVTIGRKVELPFAKPVTFGDLISGREDSGLVEVAGVVRHVHAQEGNVEIEIETPTGKVGARIVCTVEAALPLEHARVRASGVASGKFNERRQIVGAEIFVASLDLIRVEEPAPKDPFSVRRVSIHEVFRDRAGTDLTRRVLIAGTVAWQAPSGGLYLMDGEESLFAETPRMEDVAIGSRVEVVGYPALGTRFAPTLSDGVARIVGPASVVEPRKAEGATLRNGSLDAALVKVRARFIEGFDQPGLFRSTWRSEDTNAFIFDAVLTGKDGMHFERDTVADLTGVVRTLMDDQRKPAGAELNLRHTGDVAVVSTPGWWTAERMWRVVLALALVVVVSFAWVVMLRRKVEQQTRIVKQQLAKEEEVQRQYRGLFDNNPHPMWVFDPKTFHFLAVNHTAIERYGFSREEFLAMDIFQIRPADHREELKKLLTESGPRVPDETITEHQRKDGSRLFVEITPREIKFRGAPAILILAVDVTKRLEAEDALRRSEARFRRLVDSSLIGIVFFNKDGLITDANDCFLNLVGRTREALRNGAMRSVDFAPADRIERHYSALNLLHTKGAAPAMRGEILRGDGSRAPIMIGAIELEAGNEYVAFVLDLSKEAALEQQVILSQKMEAVGLLAGGVAHDFNNILQVIQGFTQISLEELDPNVTGLRENLLAVKTASDRAAELTRQLLVFSRQENLKEAEVDVAATVGDMLKLVRRVIGEHIEVNFSAAPDLAHIRGDKGRIEQLLMNLCVNARDAMPKGGALTIEASNAVLNAGDGAPVGAPTGPYVCLRVTDTGCGMDAATLARIYEPFFTTKSKEKGSGLGLSIVYGIVERHKGVIRVHSKFGAGTTFVVYFPATHATETKTPSSLPQIADKGDMETILLVEDEPAVRMLAARVLKRAGYQVREAADGVEACDVFQRHADEIDLVLMDVIMPKMGGRDAYEEIARTRNDIPVIFCSGYSERELGAEFLESRDLDLLAKPYRAEELLARIKARLHPSRHRAQA